MWWILNSPVFWIVIGIEIWLIIKLKNIIGLMGEFWVKQELKKLNDEYLIINNLMLETSDNKTHQIDHVIISKYGIFVIETKQINGYIIGNDYHNNWIVKVGKRTYYMNNPVHQNYGHIESLKEILKLSDECFVSIVCIPSRAKLKIKSDNVLRIYNLLNRINEYKEVVIENPKSIYESLLKLNITDISARKEHVKNIKKLKKEKSETFANKCPVCGSDLVTRNGKYSLFLGCSNFPRCKYIKR